MTARVVDASALIAWLLGDLPVLAAQMELALAERDTTPLIAPALIRLEVANVLAMAARKRRLTSAQARRAAAIADDAPIELEPGLGLSSTQLLLIAGTHKLSAYDAHYLELAMRRGARLLTGDADLAAAARRAGIATG